MLFVSHAPQRWKNLLLMFKRTGDVNHLNTSVWLVALAASRDAFI